MDTRRSLIVFATLIIAVNNLVLYFALQNKGIHSKIQSTGMLIFLISLIEIVAIGIYSFIHFK